MINQVLLAGRLGANPRVRQDGSGAVMELELEVERPPREASPGGRCTIGVRVSGSARQGAAWEKYLTGGRSVLVLGHLQLVDGALSVIGERLDFMEDRLVSSTLEGLARSAGRRAAAVA